MSSEGPEPVSISHQIIESLLTEFAGQWYAVKELAELEDAETKLQVLQQHFPDQDVQNLSRGEILEQIERRYWHDLFLGDFKSPVVAESLLRAVFYIGQTEAVKLAQEILELKFVDGIMGRQTKRAINKVNPEDFSTRLTQRFVDYLNQRQSQSQSIDVEQNQNVDTNDNQTSESKPNSGEGALSTDNSYEELNLAIEKMQFKQSVKADLRNYVEELEGSIGNGGGDNKESGYAEDIINNIMERLENSDIPVSDKDGLFEKIKQWLSINNVTGHYGPLESYSYARKKSDGTEESSSESENKKTSFNIDAISKKSTSDIWTIKDQLGYESYAESIAKLIIENKAEPPLTVSIQAPWGQGKTSLMRMIKHRLDHGLQIDPENNVEDKQPEEVNETPGTQARLTNLGSWIDDERQVADQGKAMLKTKPGTMPSVWFNPLYFQNSKQIWAGLAHAILHQLTGQLDNQLERERFWFRLRLTRINTQAIRRDVHKLIIERLLPKGLAWFFLLIGVVAFQLYKNVFNDYWWFSSLPAAGGILHLAYSWLKSNKDLALDDKLARYINEPNYEGDLGLLHLVEHDLDRALDLLLGKDGRLTIFIDDLDRCTPSTVTDILLAINQFISVQHRKIYFILGMDTHMVAMAIETAAEKQASAYNRNSHRSKGYGWRFMEKFVQLPFFIPRITPDQAKHFLNDLLKSQSMDLEESQEIKELKQKIDQAKDLSSLQNLVIDFKSSHNIDFIPDLDAKVASKMIDFTTEDDSETLSKLVNAALLDIELNPREMKRFLNVARLLFVRINHKGDVSNDEHMLKIVRASHLILNWPQCLRWLQGNAHCYTLKGERINPVDNIEALFDNSADYAAWYNEIKSTWGEVVANTVAQADFYAFGKRIHNSPPTLSEIFEAGIF